MEKLEYDNMAINNSKFGILLWHWGSDVADNEFTPQLCLHIILFVGTNKNLLQFATACCDLINLIIGLEPWQV